MKIYYSHASVSTTIVLALICTLISFKKKYTYLVCGVLVYTVNVRESLDLSFFSPSTGKEAIFEELPCDQLAAGDSSDSLPSDGRSGGGRTGNQRIPACK
jgi:hypothetical protein